MASYFSFFSFKNVSRLKILVNLKIGLNSEKVLTDFKFPNFPDLFPNANVTIPTSTTCTLPLQVCLNL